MLEHEVSSLNSTVPPARFFALTFALAVPFWLVGAVVAAPRGVPMGIPVSALQFVCPLLAALVLLRPDPIRRLAARFRATGRTRWYAASALVVPAVLLATYGVLGLLGSASSGAASPWWQLAALVVVFGISAACEEAGWLGCAAGPLCDRRGELRAALALGVIWGAFHLVPLVEAGRSAAWIAGWFLGTVAARVLIVRFWAATGSVLPGVLCHMTLNVGGSFVPGYLTAPVQIAFGALLAVVAAGYAATRSRGSRGELGGERA